MKGYILKRGVIRFDRELTELDLLVKDFIEILKKHCKYLIVGGYISILSGRSREIKDVDILVRKPKKKSFGKLFLDLKKNNFKCYQAELFEEVYSYVEKKQSIRFLKINKIFPNFKLIFVDKSKDFEYYELSNSQRIKIKNFKFKISPIEFEILFKEIILNKKKDIEDAQHLRYFFKDILKKDKFEKYKKVILGNENLSKYF